MAKIKVTADNCLAAAYPEVAAQWHPTKNGNMTPNDILPGSHERVWWVFPYDDPKTGKHFDFEWEAPVYSRVRGKECPFLKGRAVYVGFNDLATTHPKLAAEWHPTKNAPLTPYDVTAGCNKSVWWQQTYADTNTGKIFTFEWESRIAARALQGLLSPYLSGKKVMPGMNDFASAFPEIAKEWHPTKNGDLTPDQVTVSCNKKVWWYLPYDDEKTGKHFDFEWQERVHNRAQSRLGCPYLSGHQIMVGFNDLATTHPEIAAQWHPTKNGKKKPTDVQANSNSRAWWIYTETDEKTGETITHEWESVIFLKVRQGVGYPSGQSVGEEFVRTYLEEKNLSFSEQRRFRGLRGLGGGMLSYDFSLDEKNILLEYNGIQHYQPVDQFGGDEGLASQMEHDRRKKEYAVQHGYLLLEIPYTCDTQEKVNEYLDEKLLPFIA